MRLACEMKRDVFIAKLEIFEFENEDKIIIESLLENGKLQIFDLSNYKNDNFEGYLTRRLIENVDFDNKVRFFSFV